MYHILIVTDNRILMKRIYEMLKDNPVYKIYIVGFSVDASKMFYDYHIDVVILDTGVYMAYKSILKSFAMCQWQYRVVLLGEDNEKEANDNILFLNKKEMTKENLNQIFEEMKELSINQKGCKEGYYSDAYTLIWVKRTRGEEITDQDILRIQEEAQVYGDINLVTKRKKDVFFTINRSQMSSKYSVGLLCKAIFRAVDNYHAIIYFENISKDRIDIASEQIQCISPYSYFLENKALNFTTLPTEEVKVNIDYLDSNMQEFLNAIFDADLVIAEQVLKELYLNVIENYYDLGAREYIRMHLAILDHLFGIESSAKDELDLICDSLMEEFLRAKQRIEIYISIIDKMSDRKELTKKIMQVILKEYTEEISLEGIADKIGFNKIYLNRVMKEQLGKTILEILQLYKIQTAKYFLLTSDEKISNISKRVGYQEAGYFGKLFKKHTQMTPKDFRIKHRESWEREASCESIMEI